MGYGGGWAAIFGDIPSAAVTSGSDRFSIPLCPVLLRLCSSGLVARGPASPRGAGNAAAALLPSQPPPDDGIYWQVNMERFHQHFRDQAIVSAVANRMDQVRPGGFHPLQPDPVAVGALGSAGWGGLRHCCGPALWWSGATVGVRPAAQWGRGLRGGGALPSPAARLHGGAALDTRLLGGIHVPAAQLHGGAGLRWGGGEASTACSGVGAAHSCVLLWGELSSGQPFGAALSAVQPPIAAPHCSPHCSPACSPPLQPPLQPPIAAPIAAQRCSRCSPAVRSFGRCCGCLRSPRRRAQLTHSRSPPTRSVSPLPPSLLLPSPPGGRRVPAAPPGLQ